MNVQYLKPVLAELATTTQKRCVTGMNIIFDLSGVLFSPYITSAQQNTAPVQAIRTADFAKALHLLHDCIKQGHRLFIVSNWSKQWYEFMLADPQSAQMFKLFDDIILGDAVGIKKPDPRIFDHLIEKHRLDPRQCIFIDDQIINLKAAQQAGISRGILCQGFSLCQIRQELEQHGAL